jgi:hypothetical protein
MGTADGLRVDIGYRSDGPPLRSCLGPVGLAIASSFET